MSTKTASSEAVGLRVQTKQCSTCIYKVASKQWLAELEAQIADPHMDGFFAGYRVCHHSNHACCRGFWNRHRDDFALGQIAQRFGMVVFVNDDDRRNPTLRKADQAP